MRHYGANLVALLMIALPLGAQTSTKVMPQQGGTGKDSSHWTGCVRVDGGIWSYIPDAGHVNCGGGGGGSPASPNLSLQFNNSGSFGGSPNFVFDGADSSFNQSVLIHTPQGSGDVFQLTPESLNSTFGISPTSIHMVCDITGTNETGCNLHMQVYDIDATNHGLNPIWLQLYPSGTSTANYIGIDLEYQTPFPAPIASTTGFVTGMLTTMPLVGSYARAYGTNIGMHRGATISSEEIGLLINTPNGASLPSTYCDAIGGDDNSPHATNPRWKLGCGSTGANTFNTTTTFTGTGIPIATGTTSNSDLAGFITLSSGTGTYNFTATYATPPVCVATDTTAVAAVQATASTTVLTVNGTGTDVIAYHCIGRT